MAMSVSDIYIKKKKKSCMTSYLDGFSLKSQAI